ncbi:DUF4062 domain-containing protein [Nesterenkonia populi]|uniref:DUF4062 domain-containing protein n=1 Tax=Nesterenkonia populi TaxID=1591087 RepID=UPI0011BF3B0D|nr:DUF4062 domain-containing protein [Nesterenkonia populi]
MAYTANVLRVMIASPSDITQARDAVEAAIHGWNDANAEAKKTILQPWRYETSSVPMLGEHPQALINSQGVDRSDIVFALFGSRLGSPTPEAISGTVEEIQRAKDQNKPVHLYFSAAPHPNDVDTEQLAGLREFKEEISQLGLFGEFNTPDQLTHKVWSAIEYDIQKISLGTPRLENSRGGVHFTAQAQSDRELRDYDKRGRPRYRTRNWIDVTNAGETDAEQVTFEVVGDEPRMDLIGAHGPTTIHAGQTRPLTVGFSGGLPGPDILRIRWVEDGEPKKKDIHVG